MAITPSFFEAFLECPTKSWLRCTGEPPSGNIYAEWVQTEQESYRVAAAKRLIDIAPADACPPSPCSSRREDPHASAENLKSAKWTLALDVPAHLNFVAAEVTRLKLPPLNFRQSTLNQLIRACSRRLLRLSKPAFTP